MSLFYCPLFVSNGTSILLVANRTAPTTEHIQDTLGRGSFDEIIVSTLPPRVSRWLHLDLPSKARGLGLPVTHVQAKGFGRQAA